MGNLYHQPLPPPPRPVNQRLENGEFRLLRGFILDLGGWGFAVQFYSVLACVGAWKYRAQERTGAREGDSLPRARPFSLSPTTSKRLLRRLILSKIVAFLIEISQFVSPACENF